MKLRQRFPLLRWSVIRTGIGIRNFNRTGQIGDGRESAAADYVEANARRGDIDDVVSTIDEYAYAKSFLVNIGDEKGALLEAAVRRADPQLALELGTYCGYGALRIARAAPSARIVSVELSAANAAVARRIWEHAGVTERVTCLIGTIGDGGRTLDALRDEHGFTSGTVDFLFIDHNKDLYLSDLLSIVDRGLLRRDAIVVADNVGFPGSPKYRRYLREQQGKSFHTVEHRSHMEYQNLIPDIVVESRYLG